MPDGPAVSFERALLDGIAPDGGLYHPTAEPDLRALIRSLGTELAFVDVAAAMIEGLFPEYHDAASARQLATAAFPFAPELRRLGSDHYLLELFHGPSAAFKDFGAMFLAAAMERAIGAGGRRAVVLTATSGDTGGAVGNAFLGRAGIDVVILYPDGRISPLQEKQLTTLGGNVHAVRVAGAFDDCQRLVKGAFADGELTAQVPLTSANSINIGRLIPQSFYYVWAATQLRERLEEDPLFSVPSGNFGNLTAGVLAWRWGMPCGGFLAATNENDVVPAYLATGRYAPRPSRETLATAMDVGAPSNLERLERIFDSGTLVGSGMLHGHVTSDARIREVMRAVRRDSDLFVCPHTACGIDATWDYLGEEPGDGAPVITLATAHAAKFVEVSRDVLGEAPALPPQLVKLLDREGTSTPMDATADALRHYLLERFV